MLLRIIKKPVFIILTVMAAAIGLVVLLAWIALKPINQKNGFNRVFIATELTRLAVAEKDEIVTAIAGTTDHHIYFKTKDPAKLWMTDRDLQNGKYITLNVPNNKRIASAFYSVVDSPVVHIMAGNGPAVIKTDLNGSIPLIYRFPAALYTRAVVIGPSSYVFRGFDATEKKAGQLFIKGNPQTGIIKTSKSITKQDYDGAGITTDGHLSYDNQNNLLIYVSFYNNHIFYLDTNLSLLYKGHTIDTVNADRIEAGRVGSTITNTSPVRVINEKSRLANGNLYVISKLKAENEKAVKFDRSATVDVYNIMKREYKGSFYLPFYKRGKISDFKVIGGSLVVLYKNYVILYQLPKAVGV